MEILINMNVEYINILEYILTCSIENDDSIRQMGHCNELYTIATDKAVKDWISEYII